MFLANIRRLEISYIFIYYSTFDFISNNQMFSNPLLVIQPGQFRANLNNNRARTVSHVTLSMGKDEDGFHLWNQGWQK